MLLITNTTRNNFKMIQLFDPPNLPARKATLPFKARNEHRLNSRTLSQSGERSTLDLPRLGQQNLSSGEKSTFTSRQRVESYGMSLPHHQAPVLGATSITGSGSVRNMNRGVKDPESRIQKSGGYPSIHQGDLRFRVRTNRS